MKKNGEAETLLNIVSLEQLKNEDSKEAEDAEEVLVDPKEHKKDVQKRIGRSLLAPLKICEWVCSRFVFGLFHGLCRFRRVSWCERDTE